MQVVANFEKLEPMTLKGSLVTTHTTCNVTALDSPAVSSRESVAA